LTQYRNILVTGGAGFIGSHYVKWVLKARPDARVTVLDKLTYAGNLANLAEVRGRIRFVRGDIADFKVVRPLFKNLRAVAHFAAETHVDRSIGSAGDFLRTNVLGTQVLLQAAQEAGVKRFVHVSTDEVYGSRPKGYFTEDDTLRPSSPYSASKAASDLLALSYFTTYGLPVMVTRCTNNYGPNQYPEKLIPLFITNLVEGKKVPVYGDGTNRRDWIYVEDHCRAVDLVLGRGKPGQDYNIAGGQEKDNLAVTRTVLKLMGLGLQRIQYVKDRPGHDWRYAISDARIRRMGFKPKESFESGIARTVAWYKANAAWWEPIKSGAFKQYYLKHYGKG
jgi:dTDP-glucose 4,6-dehydratase